MKDRLKGLTRRATEVLDRASVAATGAGKAGRDYVARNKDGWRESLGTAGDVTLQFSSSASREMSDRLRGACTWLTYSVARERQLRADIEAQGALYREHLKTGSPIDALVVGGESLSRMLEVGEVPKEIEAAFAAAYPGLAEDTTFLDHTSDLDEGQLQGFLAGVKGKLFELKYVDMLNDGMLPDGYTADLAGNANQAGWDISIVGPDDSVVEVLQAKATDSVGYVRDAIEQYPAIDVVATEEVYSHLVMSGVGVQVTNSGISNDALEEAVSDASLAGDVAADFAPPVISLAFIAFTSYRDENLTLYQKAQKAGERSGAVYLATLIGGLIAEGTDSFWLGVAGTLVSKLLGDKTAKRAKLIDLLKRTKGTNQVLIDRAGQAPALPTN